MFYNTFSILYQLTEISIAHTKTSELIKF